MDDLGEQTFLEQHNTLALVPHNLKYLFILVKFCIYVTLQL